MEPVFTRRILLVVAAADRDRANQTALQFDPEGGDNTFSEGLSPTGQEPATHYWCSTSMTEETYQAVRYQVLPQFEGARLRSWNLDTERSAPRLLLQEMGLKRVARAEA